MTSLTHQFTGGIKVKNPGQFTCRHQELVGMSVFNSLNWLRMEGKLFLCYMEANPGYTSHSVKLQLTESK